MITQIISAEEFWQNHAAEYVNKNSGVKQEVANDLKYIEIVIVSLNVRKHITFSWVVILKPTHVVRHIPLCWGFLSNIHSCHGLLLF